MEEITDVFRRQVMTTFVDEEDNFLYVTQKFIGSHVLPGVCECENPGNKVQRLRTAVERQMEQPSMDSTKKKQVFYSPRLSCFPYTIFPLYSSVFIAR